MDRILTYKDIDETKVSPMMREYLSTKKEYPDAILFYRLGDFYEMFFDDALTVSRELELTLTGKACGLEERAPMCGVPYHAMDTYLSKLIDKGYKVAVCEQMEDPRLAKGIVKREVIRVVTPGTTLNMQALNEKNNNYIACIYYRDGSSGLAVCDITTGDFNLTETDSRSALIGELIRYSPAEIVCNNELLTEGIDTADLGNSLHAVVNCLPSDDFDEEKAGSLVLKQFNSGSLRSLDIEFFHKGVSAAGALLSYLIRLQKTELSVFTRLNAYRSGKYMLLDNATRRNLELTETLRGREKKGSLLWVLDKTKTAMGARLLRNQLEQPLLDVSEIEKRLSAVDSMYRGAIPREELREYLGPVYDLERLLSKITYKTANPRDIQAFGSSVRGLSDIRNVLSEFEDSSALEELYRELDPLTDLSDLISDALAEELPLTVREGGIFREGYSEELDHLREAGANGKQWLARLEEKEREKSGIKNLRIKYSGVFGYTFEVTNSFKDLVPDHFIRRQTLTNCERYTTDELKKLEDEILGAQDKANALEYELFCTLRDAIGSEASRIQKTARMVAFADMFASLAYVAERYKYTRPEIDESGKLIIKGGRHPVVERIQEISGMFIPNDTRLDNRENSVAIITGPNMAGKSTYMRQTALIVLMAQIGSFVPADSARIGIVDRVFTRVGASDDLSSGQSTFMVEMNEVSNILRNATNNSLLILDEIGRGTSTYDGLSIAWAVVEHIANRRLLGARTLFATHYHELTQLEGKLDNVHNYCIAVKEKGDEIVFLRKIIKGGADRSYGIQVARLAGLPEMVIDRAKEIADELVRTSGMTRLELIPSETPLAADPSGTAAPRGKKKHYDEVDLTQMSLFDTVDDDAVINELRDLDVNALTPVDALNELYRLQSLVKNRWKG